jgi:RHS repeat-associated protein
VAEIRYYPWGTERYTYGTTPTSYHFTGQRLESGIGLYYYGARWYDPAAGRFIQADSIIPLQQGVQGWDRYAYANNNPLNYTDDSGHFAWFVSGGIGAAIGGIVGGVVYSVCNRDNFSTSGLLTAIGAGAVAGGLIGSGVGLLAAPATSAALATAATAMVGAGTGAAGSAAGYTFTNQNAFDSKDFVETTAIGGAVGGISAVTPLSTLGVAVKATTYIAGAEAQYALQTDEWTVGGAQRAAVFGALGGGFDVVGTWAISNSSSTLTNIYPSRGPQGYTPQSSTSDILSSASRLRAGQGIMNTGSGLLSGFIASTTTWVVNRFTNIAR